MKTFGKKGVVLVMDSWIVSNPFAAFRKKRVASYDFMKFVALMFVMLDHTFQHWRPVLTQSVFYNFIFLTQMPLFFFIAGYFSSRKATSVSRFLDCAKNELRACDFYLIPFFSFALLKWASGGYMSSSLFEHLFLIISHPQNGLWFLWVLFWMETILNLSGFFAGFIKRTPLKKIITIVFYLLCLSVPAALYLFANDFGDAKLLIYYSLFFLLGPILMPILEKVTSIGDGEKRHLLMALLVAISLLFLTFALNYSPSYLNAPDTLINISLRVLGGLSSIAAIVLVCSELCRLSLFQRISKLGMFSLETYYVHVFLLSIPAIDGLFRKWPFAWSFATLVLITYGIIFAIKTFPILDCVIFGKIPSKKKNCRP